MEFESVQFYRTVITYWQTVTQMERLDLQKSQGFKML